MFHDVLLALASIAIVLSPCVIDTLSYRGLDRSREAQHRDWVKSMTS